MTRLRLPRLAAGLAVATLALAACGGQSGSGGGSGQQSTTLTVVNTSGSLWTCNYNPFAPTAVDTNLVYEPLYVINDLTGQQDPWLATSYEWSADNKELTLTLRDGVTWNDGKPFTAADVAFTFNLEKKYPALDTYALWSDGVLSAVTAEGTDKVRFSFARVSTSSFRYIVSTRIKPEHIWASVTDPVKANSKQTVGTGPYKIGSCSPQSITYVKNPHYWQKGKPLVDKVLYPAFVDNEPANRYLAQGKGDWGGQFVPNIEKYWVAKDPKHRRFWYPAVSNVGIAINVTKPYLNDARVRQALAYAVDKEKVSTKAMYGYQKPADQTGIVDTFKEWRDEEASAKYGYTYDCAKAAAKLEEAGFTKGPDGMFRTPDGKELKLELINNGGFTDWVGAVKIIGESMKTCGINLQVSNLNGNQFDSRRLKGQFDLSYDSQSAGPTPYFELRNWLFSKLTMPIGQDASANHGRWKDAKTDEYIRAYDQTLDKSEQMAVVRGLQHIMLEQVPFIPVTQNVSWSQMDSTRFTGWPSESNPYANPAPYSANWEVVLLHLKPVSK